MPMLDLTPLECKIAWLIFDSPQYDEMAHLDRDSREAATSLFEKFYRAYRGMPPEKAA